MVCQNGATLKTGSAPSTDQYKLEELAHVFRTNYRWHHLEIPEWSKGYSDFAGDEASSSLSATFPVPNYFQGLRLSRVSLPSVRFS